MGRKNNENKVESGKTLKAANKFNNKKKNIKVKVKRFNVKNEKKNFSKLPSHSGEFSSNWESFLASQPNTAKKLVSGNSKNHILKHANPAKHKYKKKNTNSKENSIVNGEIWFDDVDPSLIQKECGVKNDSKTNKFATRKTQSQKSSPVIPKAEDTVDKEMNITRYVGLDCEMVGVGINGKENVLARVSIVNSLGDCIYDKFVKPVERVVDFRTEVSGVRPSDLKDAPSYEVVQKEVFDILKGRILVGHALQNDLKVLMLGHSRRQTRDTARYKPFRQLLKTKRPALRKLASEILHETIQCGEHSSVVDARVTMKLYQLHKKEWERSLRVKGGDAATVHIFMGGSEEKKRKNNKWTKIKQRKNQKLTS